MVRSYELRGELAHTKALSSAGRESAQPVSSSDAACYTVGGNEISRPLTAEERVVLGKGEQLGNVNASTPGISGSRHSPTSS